MRIYVVSFNQVDRLVEANSPSQAVKIVAEGMITARPAKPQDVKRIMEAGGKHFTGEKEAEHGGA